MRFSVIIPTYNRENYILATLDSVFAQTFQDFEIVIVDNCSTDNTVAILEERFSSHPQIRLVKNAQNLERSRARNVGIEHASGDFVTFLDSDDFFYPDCLKDAHDFTQANPELKIFHNYYELIDGDKKVVYKYVFPKSLENHHLEIIRGNFFSCIGVFIAGEVIKENRFDENEVVIGSEDWELWIRILAKHKPGRIEKINCGVLHHEGRSLDKFTIDSALVRVHYIADKIKSDPGLNRAYRKYLHKFYASGYLFAASSANSAKMFNLARKLVFKAIGYDWTCIFEKKCIRIFQIALFKIKK
ncbi:MAG: glycosyltransferase family 2 protein [Bacteroidota bacterium]